MTQASTTAQTGSIHCPSKVYIGDHRAMVGYAVWRHLKSEGCPILIGQGSADLGLRDTRALQSPLRRQRPDLIIDAAEMVGGAIANSTDPEEFLSNNLRIQVILTDAAQQNHAPKIPFLGSSCSCDGPALNQSSKTAYWPDPSSPLMMRKRSQGSPASGTFRCCGASTVCTVSRRCRQTSMAPTTTSIRSKAT